MDMPEAFREASGEFLERAERIEEAQWTSPTPCTEWDVRTLVNHVAGEWLWVPELMAGRTIAEVGDRFDGDVLGAKPVATLRDARERAVASFSSASSLDQLVHLSFGDVAASDYAMQMVIDGVIHAWDLARAIGADETLDERVVDIAYAELQRAAEGWRAAGAFGPAKDPVDGSTQARLIALTGR